MSKKIDDKEKLKNKVLGVRLPYKTYEKLKKISEENNKTPSEYVREIIEILIKNPDYLRLILKDLPKKLEDIDGTLEAVAAFQSGQPGIFIRNP